MSTAIDCTDKNEAIVARLHQWAESWSKATGGMSESDKGWMFAAREVLQILHSDPFGDADAVEGDSKW